MIVAADNLNLVFLCIQLLQYSAIAIAIAKAVDDRQALLINCASAMRRGGYLAFAKGVGGWQSDQVLGLP